MFGACKLIHILIFNRGNSAIITVTVLGGEVRNVVGEAHEICAFGPISVVTKSG